MNVYRHTGDLGDVIAGLAVMRQLGPGQLILGNVNGAGAREPMDEVRFSVISPLIACQPYITAVSHEHDAKGVTHDFANFRNMACRIGEEHNLVNWQGDFFGDKDIDLTPWLHGVVPSEETKGKAVFARTTRYHGTKFNWPGIIRQWHSRAIFVGLEEDYTAFRVATGKDHVPWRRTSNLLEVAELIAGSELLVSNQCVASWIAMAMAHPLIQEVCHWSVNSIIRRDNAEFHY